MAVRADRREGRGGGRIERGRGSERGREREEVREEEREEVDTGKGDRVKGEDIEDSGLP